jgi:hypothetical protein
MTEKVLEYLFRGIVQHINGDKEKAEEYAIKAMELDERICICGGQTIPCRYNKRYSRLCTDCGLIWRGKNIVQRCWVNSRRAG